MVNEPTEPDVAVSPTLGKIDDLQSAAEDHRHAAEVPVEHQHEAPPYDEEEVTGGPTLGSMNELRFAHHAHQAEKERGEVPTGE